MKKGKILFSIEEEGYGHPTGGEENVANFQCSMVPMQSEMNIALSGGTSQTGSFSPSKHREQKFLTLA